MGDKGSYDENENCNKHNSRVFNQFYTQPSRPLISTYFWFCISIPLLNPSINFCTMQFHEIITKYNAHFGLHSCVYGFLSISSLDSVTKEDS